MRQAPEFLAALLCGGVFGFGLALSGMLDPARVRGFLDIFGRFDPSLAFVLAGAVAVSALGVAAARRMAAPALGGEFEIPPRRRIDRSLILGAALFGVGWGLAGLCPGPAIAALGLGLPPAFLFAAAMVTGMLLHDGWRRRRAARTAALAPEAADA